MKSIASITDFKLFTQAVDQYAKDREALKQIKSFLLDDKFKIEARMDDPFSIEVQTEEWRGRMKYGHQQLVRRMNHVDSILSKTKETTGGFLCWIIERVEGAVKHEGWVATSVHPIMWLCERLSEEDDPDNLELSHFFPLTSEQFSQLNKEIPRV